MLYNFLDPSNFGLSNDVSKTPVMPLPDDALEGPPIDVLSDALPLTLPPLKRSTHVNFSKPPDRLTLFTNLNSVVIPSTYKQEME